MFTDQNLMLTSRYFLIGCTAVLAVLLFFCILRSIKGPRIADRILSVNMSGTMIIAAIVFFSVIFGDESLIDVSLLYALISFLAVVVFTRVFRGEYIALKDKRREAADLLEARAYEEGDDEDGDA